LRWAAWWSRRALRAQQRAMLVIGFIGAGREPVSCREKEPEQ